MEHVGFPNGLGITEDEVKKDIRHSFSNTGKQLLIIESKCTPIGEMNYSIKDKENGIVEIGVKICELGYQGKGIEKIKGTHS